MPQKVMNIGLTSRNGWALRAIVALEMPQPDLPQDARLTLRSPRHARNQAVRNHPISAVLCGVCDGSDVRSDDIAMRWRIASRIAGRIAIRIGSRIAIRIAVRISC